MTVDGASPDGSGREEFTRLRFDGTGISEKRVPFEQLEEFTRYRLLVLEAARAAWLADNPELDLPEDFDSSLKLELAPFEQGSAVAVIERPDVSPYENYYTNGRDTVQIGLKAVAVDVVPPTDLDFLSGPAFRDFGKSLPSGRLMQLLPTPNGQAVVDVTSKVYTDRIKKTYSKAKREANTRETVKGSIAGRLTMLNPEKRNFTVRTLAHGEVNGRYRNPEQTADLRQVLDSSAHAPVVRFDGQLRFDGRRLVSVLDVEHVELMEVDGQPWSRRFIELASLAAGWGEDKAGELISFTALDAAGEILRRSSEQGVRLPGIFGMEDGGVQIEWPTPQRVVSVEISPDGELWCMDVDVATRTPRELETEDIAAAAGFLLGALQ